MTCRAAAVLLLLALLAAVPAAAIEGVRFPVAGGPGEAPVELAAKLDHPPGPGPFPAVVLLHGCGGLLDSKGHLTARHADWNKRFVALGYLVLLVDSFGPRGLGNQCIVRERSLTASGDRVRDAFAALRYLQGRPEARPDRISLMGWSNGASVVLGALAPENPARAADVAPGFYRAVALYPGCTGVARNFPDYQPSLPLLILSGGDDDWTPVDPCRKLVDKARKKGAPIELVIYPNAFHGFDNPDVPLAYWPNVRNTSKPDACCGAHVGTDQAARDDALHRVPAFLEGR